MSHKADISYDIILGLLGTSIILLFIALLFFLFRKRPIHDHDHQSNDQVQPIRACAQAYRLTDIDEATQGFNPQRVIGEDHLGTIYAAALSQRDHHHDSQEVVVAIKRIHPHLVFTANYGLGFSFSSKMRSLSYAQDTNLVPIVGYCEAPGERIIVMEFVGVVSLDYYLHQDPDGGVVLDWSQRLRIASGVARGLKHLHEGMAPGIVHGCVKSSNVLIDVNFYARVSDFGLNFLAPKHKKGLVGYVDEEYWDVRNGGACKENDVYGFGVILLEILSGRSCEDGWLMKWALPLIKETRFSEVFDPRLIVPFDMKPLVRLAKVALACVGNSRKNRPTMGQVEAILSDLEIVVCA